jgi:hypothetical protein
MAYRAMLLGALFMGAALVGRSLYQDWAFLHKARLTYEAQMKVPAPKTQGGGNVKEGAPNTQ